MTEPTETPTVAEPPKGAPSPVSPGQVVTGPPPGMPPEEAKKWAAAQAKLTGQPPAEAPAPNPEPAAAAPQEAAAPQDSPNAPPDGFPTGEQINERMQEIQRTLQLTEPYMKALQQMLNSKDPLVYHILSEISTSTAQLVRILSDYHRRAGNMQVALIPFVQPQTAKDGNVDWGFVKIAMMLLANPIVEQYIHTPGPQYWIQYLNQGSLLDLAKRQEMLAALQGATSPPPSQPRSYRPGVKPV